MTEIAHLKELNKNEYYPSVKLKYRKQHKKSVTVDNEVYTKEWYEENIFDSDTEINNRFTDRDWRKNELNLSFIHHHNIIFWDYHGFDGGGISYHLHWWHDATKKQWEDILYEYIYYDYDNPITTITKYKTVPDKVVTSFKPTKKSVFNKKIVKRLYWGRGNRYIDVNYSVTNGCIPLDIEDANRVIDVPFSHMLKCDIYKFPECYKKQIERYIDCNYNELDLPKYFLSRKINDVEINKLLLSFFKIQIKLKRKKS